MYFLFNIKAQKADIETMHIIAVSSDIFITVGYFSFATTYKPIALATRSPSKRKSEIFKTISCFLLRRLSKSASHNRPTNTANAGKRGKIYVGSFEREREKNINMTKIHMSKNKFAFFILGSFSRNPCHVPRGKNILQGKKPKITIGI